MQLFACLEQTGHTTYTQVLCPKYFLDFPHDPDLTCEYSIPVTHTCLKRTVIWEPGLKLIKVKMIHFLEKKGINVFTVFYFFKLLII